MTGRETQIKNEMEKISKIMDEMTPERRSAIDRAFSNMQRHGDDTEIPMRQLHFGGEYSFDLNRSQVELHGEFSKEDLLRIAMVMK